MLYFIPIGAACRVHQDEYRGALRDAEKCVKYNPDWAKGYLRVANALFGLGDYVGAEQARGRGLSIDPEHSALSKLKARLKVETKEPLEVQREMHRLREDQRHRGSLKKTLKGLPGARRRRGARHLQGHRGDDVEDGHAARRGTCVEIIYQWPRRTSTPCPRRRCVGTRGIVASMAWASTPSSRRRNGKTIASMAWGVRNLIPHRPPGVAGMAGLDMANLPSAAAAHDERERAEKPRAAPRGREASASARRRGRGGERRGV